LRSKYKTAVHASALLIPYLTEATSKSTVLTALIAVTALYLVSEAYRLKGERLPLITEFTLRMSREDEKTHFVAGPVYLAAGVILSLLLFPKSSAYASVTIVAVGDPVASYFGQRFGRTHVGRKTLEGFAAGLIVSFAGALLWVDPNLALIGSVAGMLLELLGIPDANLAMPIGADSAMVIACII
jgi:dolichol kinase